MSETTLYVTEPAEETAIEVPATLNELALQRARQALIAFGFALLQCQDGTSVLLTDSSRVTATVLR